ncbi:hypothetical protein AVEN_79563-1 [Araneus ventricosus]|uniref:Uncharacterized protein n=1 Tax=Araneus ventricosus TaxID=182803 RepID=A0A4Y2J323_ARAVE|nr:hypothetical protein AVEN_79563-1 [Araneus ventricosus]
MFSFPASTVPTTERVQSFSCQPQTTGQLHLVVFKETFARVIASRRKATTMHRNQYRQRVHMGSTLRRLAVLFHVTPVKPRWWRNPRTFPTVGFDHWEYGRLVVGHPGVRLASRMEGRRSSTP